MMTKTYMYNDIYIHRCTICIVFHHISIHTHTLTHYKHVMQNMLIYSKTTSNHIMYINIHTHTHTCNVKDTATSCISYIYTMSSYVYHIEYTCNNDTYMCIKTSIHIHISYIQTIPLNARLFISLVPQLPRQRTWWKPSRQPMPMRRSWIILCWP